jgi:hypothetical protein
MHEQITLMMKWEGERNYLENTSKWSISPLFGLIVSFFFEETFKSAYITLEK